MGRCRGISEKTGDGFKSVPATSGSGLTGSEVRDETEVRYAIYSILLMRRYQQVLYALLFFICAGSAYPVDLMEIYGHALDNDPQYLQVAASRRATLEQRPQARAGLLPSLSISANAFTNEEDIDSQFNPIDRPSKVSFGSHGYSLDLVQPLFNGERIVTYLQADNLINQADAELDAARQDLMVRTTDAYFEILAAHDNLGFAEAEKKSLSRQLEQAQQRFEVGLSAITDVQEAQAGYDRAVAAEIAARNNVDNTLEALREITGIYFSELAQLGVTMPLVNPQPEEIETWSSAALEQNLDVQAAQHAVDSARREVQKRRTGHLPSLDMVARHSYFSTGGRFGNFDNTTNSIGVEVTMPIFQGGYVSSRVRETRERLNAELERLEQARRNAQRLTRQAYLGVISGISQVKALKQAVVSSETALAATEAGFEVGTRTAVDVVAAERATSQARRDYARARYDYLLDTLRLKQAAGSLSAEDLSQVNRWLE